jgi:Arc/MetJ-type ribon-helix-helix transcriptional regulator
MSQTPERYNVSIPPDHPLAGQLDDLVEASEYDNRSEYVRQAILDAEDDV